ncbi:MAG TPA: O-antigen ligase family protein [Terriglobia bacterium]|nr:O-antigen ligase family protein [Terriglobia bacterium]
MTSLSPELVDVRSGPAPRSFSAARVLLGVMLVAAPLPFGAVYTWAWASITLLTLLVLVLWMVGSIEEGRLRIGYSPLYVPIALSLALGVVQLSFHLTLTPIATKESVVKLATYFILFFVVIQLFAGSPVETWRRVGLAVLVFGFVFSFLSILQFLWNPNRILGVGHDLATPFGPYVDRDHYAGLMEMVIPLSASYVLSRPKRDPLSGLLWFAVTVPVVSLLLTGSRGAFISILVEITILGWILIWRNPLPGRRMRVAAMGLVLVAVTGLFFWLVPTFVLSKLGTVNSYVPEASEGSRLGLWRNSLGILRDHPLVGAGMGSFVTVYPAYQTEAQDLITEHSHNDYVEALTETGLLGGGLILAALIMFIPMTFRNLGFQLKLEQGWIQLGAAIACCGLLIHSFVDFNLHIPANATWFAFCAGLASLSSCLIRTPSETARAGNFQSPFQSQ